MLNALLADFAALPSVEPVALVAEDLAISDFGKARVLRVPHGKFEACFSEAVQTADMALLVAPEIGRILGRLAAEVERVGGHLLGPSAAAIEVATDKLATEAVLRTAGLPVPESLEWRLDSPPPPVHFPVVVKPVDGVGGLGLSVVESSAAFGRAVHTLQRATGAERALVQPWLDGTTVSVTLIGDGRRARPLCLNSQIVDFGPPAHYLGGETPVAHSMRDAAFAVASAVAEAIPGLRGYFGVDLVLTDEGPVILDVNPRVTTAYAGLRAATAANIAHLMFAAVAGHLPLAPRLVRRVRFRPEGVIWSEPL